MSDKIALIIDTGIAAVLAPSDFVFASIADNLITCSKKQGANDFFVFDRNSVKPLNARPTHEAQQRRFYRVVQVMSCGSQVKMILLHQLLEPRIAQCTGSHLN